jgi:hypothetical protein
MKNLLDVPAVFVKQHDQIGRNVKSLVGEDGGKMADKYWKKDRVGSPGPGQK